MLPAPTLNSSDMLQVGDKSMASYGAVLLTGLTYNCVTAWTYDNTGCMTNSEGNQLLLRHHIRESQHFALQDSCGVLIVSIMKMDLWVLLLKTLSSSSYYWWNTQAYKYTATEHFCRFVNHKNSKIGGILLSVFNSNIKLYSSLWQPTAESLLTLSLTKNPETLPFQILVPMSLALSSPVHKVSLLW